MGRSQAPRRMLITGGAGFIGVNAADHFLREGWRVTIFDNLSRAGTERNLDWIQRSHPGAIEFIRAEIQDQGAVAAAVVGKDAILHLAAQVAVTTSMAEPEPDFEVNARGTFNVLEAVRRQAPGAALLFASTNKVYGSLEGWKFENDGRRWIVVGRSSDGVSEAERLDFHSPYGCSKGAADQYVRDYARCYGLRTVVFRQSCVYGSHQYGNEDQGWVAHFVHAVSGGRPITIYGDGGQVRDLLDVRDLCRLYSASLAQIDRCAGDIFNIGGGPANSRSVLEVLGAIERMVETDAHYTFSDWRAGDQLYYVSDLGHVEARLGWRPEITFEAGLQHLVAWAQLENATAETV